MKRRTLMREAAAIARVFCREFAPGTMEAKPNVNAGENEAGAHGTLKATVLEAITAGMADDGPKFQN